MNNVITKHHFLLSFLCFSFLKLSAFTFVCPGDITIPCDSDLSDLNRYGKAYTEHNGYKTWVHDCKVVYKLNDCGIGTITRTWGVEDTAWHWITCQQVITLSNTNVFTLRDIDWPDDLTIESCDPLTDLKNLSKPYNRPYYPTKVCTRPMYSYSDTWFRVDSGCQKLLREWKILDWCVYDPKSSAPKGIFSHTQIIKLVTSDTSVKLLVKKDTTVFATLDCRGVEVIFEPAKLISSCNVPHTIRNTSNYSKEKNADPSGIYPVGKTSFEVIGEYACGREIKCQITVNVVLKIPPVAYCLPGVIIDLMPIDTDGDGKADEGMVDVWASDLNKGSYHPCPGRKLKYSFSSDTSDKVRTYTCDHVGFNDVEIWITDDLGNQSFCKTRIEIQKNMIDDPKCGKTNIVQDRVDLFLDMQDQFGKKVTDSKIFVLSKSMNHKVNSQIVNGSSMLLFEKIYKDNSYEIVTQDCDYNWDNIDQNDVTVLTNMLSGKKYPEDIRIAADLNGNYKVDIDDLTILKSMIKSKKTLGSGAWVVCSFGMTLDEIGLHQNSYKNVTLQVSSDLHYSIIQKGNLAIEKFKPTTVEHKTTIDLTDGFSVTGQASKRIFYRANTAKSNSLILKFYDLQGKSVANFSIEASEGLLELPIGEGGLFIFSFEDKDNSVVRFGKVWLIN